MAENLDALKCGGWGVFIAPPTKMVVGEAVCRWAHRTVRCASHVTQPLGFDRWSSDRRGHQTVRWCTGQSLFIVRCAFWRLLWLCTHYPRTVHLSANRWSQPLRLEVVAPLPHRTVQWIIAEWLSKNPKLSSSELISLVHRTLSGGTPNSPVRQTRAAFGWFCSFLFEPYLGLFIGLCWTFGTCGTYNLEQTS
jgi:hypothetical protein